MKRKVSTVFVIAMVILLVAATALAVSLSRSAGNEAARIAREALMEKYGITHETIGIFLEEISADGSGWKVVYTPRKYQHDAIGTYEVIVAGGKVKEIAWTHDDAAQEELQGGLDASVWGQEQLQMVLSLEQTYERNLHDYFKQATPEEREAMTLEDRAALDRELLGEANLGISIHVAPGEDDIQEDEAIEHAFEAIHDKFGFTREELADHEIRMDFRENQWDNNQRWYHFTISRDRGGDDWHSFDVKFDSPSGEIWSCGWGAAEPRLPAGPLEGHEAVVEEFVKAGGFVKLGSEEKAEVSRRIHEAGYGKYIGNRTYIRPEAGDGTEGEALAAAKAALLDRYGLTDEMLTLFEASTGLTKEGDARVWAVEYTPVVEYYWSTDFTPMYGEYAVEMDAGNMRVREAIWTLEDVDDGKTYTKNNWATAPAWNSRILPWVVEFGAAQKALEAKYADQLSTQWSMEDFAARDQLFRDAGFVADEDHYNDGMPGEGDISLEEAIELAFDALREDYALDGEDRDHLIIVPYFHVHIPDKPIWRIDIFDKNASSVAYHVNIEARTGLIIDTEYEAAGNG